MTNIHIYANVSAKDIYLRTVFISVDILIMYITGVFTNYYFIINRFDYNTTALENLVLFFSIFHTITNIQIYGNVSIC